jgi:hypothetical protein
MSINSTRERRQPIPEQRNTGFRRPASSGVVIGWGCAGEPAEAYARKQGRPFAVYPDRAAALSDLTRLCTRHRSVLVVAPEPDVDFAGINALMSASLSARVPVGVLPLPEDPTARAVLLNQVTRLTDAAPRPTSTVLYCDFSHEPPADLPHAHGSGQARAFMEKLVGGVDALVLHSHGNGADFRVGDQVLCLGVGAGAPRRGSAGEHFLPCQGGGACRLDHKKGFVAYHGAAAVNARLVVMLSCSAYQPHGGVLDARFQFSQHLLRAGRVAAVVASSRINHGTPQLGVAVTRLLEDGASMGEVALRINRLAAEGTASYVCLGDPDLTLPDRNMISGSGPTSGRSKPLPTAATTVSLATAAPSAPDVVPSPARDVDLLFAADLAARIGSISTAAALAQAASSRPAVTSRFDHLITRIVARSLADTGADPFWQALCRPVDRRPGEPCPLCARDTQEETYAALLYANYQRRVSWCPEHGMVRDDSAGGVPHPRTVRWEQGSRTLRWNPAGLDGACRIIARHHGDLRPLLASGAAGHRHVPEAYGNDLTLVHATAASFATARAVSADTAVEHV